jgi:stress-induced morphogen
MAMTPQEIRATIERALPGSRVEVHDTTGTGDHFEAIVLAEQFVGKTVVEQHRMVYAILGPAMAGPIHALALRTSAPSRDSSRPT